MTRFDVFIGFCVIVACIQATVQIKCGLNEAEDDCPADCSDHCALNEKQDKSCTIPSVCGPSQCKCRFDYRRAANGTCIPTRDCPPFPCDRPNEEYVACPLLCPTDSCYQATPDGRCPLPFTIGIVVPCNPQCRCIKGYWRSHGKCIPYEQCPYKPQVNSMFNAERK